MIPTTCGRWDWTTPRGGRTATGAGRTAGVGSAGRTGSTSVAGSGSSYRYAVGRPGRLCPGRRLPQRHRSRPRSRGPAIGYANKPGKRERLAAADVVIDSMADLVAAFAVNEL